MIPRSGNSVHNFQYVVAQVDADKAGLTRDELISALRLENVHARRYFYPGCHRMQPYAGLFPRAGRSLPVTEDVAERVMVLPTGLSVSLADVDQMCSRITAIVQQASEVRKALRQSEDPRLPPFAKWDSENALNHH